MVSSLTCMKSRSSIKVPCYCLGKETQHTKKEDHPNKRRPPTLRSHLLGRHTWAQCTQHLLIYNKKPASVGCGCLSLPLSSILFGWLYTVVFGRPAVHLCNYKNSLCDFQSSWLWNVKVLNAYWWRKEMCFLVS